MSVTMISPVKSCGSHVVDMHVIPTPRHVPLFDPQFEHQPAAIRLGEGSAELSAALSLNGVPATYRDLALAGFSPHSAWDDAAVELIRRARRVQGVEVCQRHARSLIRGLRSTAPAMQVAFGSGDPSSWLAHPYTFAVVHYFFLRQWGNAPVYFAPIPGVLLAYDPRAKSASASVEKRVRTWVQGVYMRAKNRGECAITGRGIIYAEGYAEIE